MIVLFLTLGACNTIASTVLYQAVEKLTARAGLTINPKLMEAKSLSKVPRLPANPSPDDVKFIHERAIILGGAAVLFHGKYTELIGAVKQREHSEAQIVAQEEKRAAEADALIEKLNAIEAERGKSWYKRILGD